LKLLAPELFDAFQRSLLSSEEEEDELDSDNSFDASTLLNEQSASPSKQSTPIVEGVAKGKLMAKEMFLSRLPAPSSSLSLKLQKSKTVARGNTSQPSQGSTQASTSKQMIGSSTPTLTSSTPTTASPRKVPISRGPVARKSASGPAALNLLAASKITVAARKSVNGVEREISGGASQRIKKEKVKEKDMIKEKPKFQRGVVEMSSSPDELKLSAIKKAPIVIELSDSDEQMDELVIEESDKDLNDGEISSPPRSPKKSALLRGRPASVSISAPAILPSKKPTLVRGRQKLAMLVQNEKAEEAEAEDAEGEEDDERSDSGVPMLSRLRHRAPRRVDSKAIMEINISSDSDDNDNASYRDRRGRSSSQFSPHLGTRSGLRTRATAEKRQRSSSESDGNLLIKIVSKKKKEKVMYIEEEEDSDAKERVKARGKGLDNLKPQYSHSAVSLF
jgi:hypothetical protein